MKCLVLLLFLVLTLIAIPPAEAALCRQLDDRQICILSIKRSAKNYWEYRATVSIDGIARPIEVYNCRDRLRVRQDGSIVRFEPGGAGELICSILAT